MELTTKQKAYLRGLAQELRPQLHVGYGGLTAGIQGALEDLFKRRELVKARVLKTTDEEPAAIAERLAESTRSNVVGMVGKTFVLYRPNPEMKERIELPDAPRPRPAPSAPASPAVRPRLRRSASDTP